MRKGAALEHRVSFWERHSLHRLTKVYADAPLLPYGNHSKIVIMSDCHRGVANWGDNFGPNQNIYFAALNHYYKKGFSYIELGDGEELWENRKPKQIIDAHSDAYWLLAKFYKNGRFLMIYGNHDRKKCKKRYMQKHFSKFYDASERTMVDLFPGMTAYEGICLQNQSTGRELFLTHGHQGELLNDYFWKLGRFLVRYLWKPLELLGFQDPTDAARNYRRANRVEKKLKKWVMLHDQPTVCGHTHRPHMPQCTGLENENYRIPYFNSGSCVHPRCITALEIQNGEITLVKWAVFTKEDGSLYVDSQLLDGPCRL